MQVANIKIEDLIGKDQKLTFLVGAGCSIDPPSCQPAGRAMLDAMIKYSCIESEVNEILDLKHLRFEFLVEFIRDLLDSDLKLIDYYGQCNKPNIQHFFLAEMIKKGNFVMTTNFDFLIEHALLQSKVKKKQIIPVITKSDFQKYSDPLILEKKGKKTIFKLHGSTKNIITKKNTKDSLITTIQAFGSNKEGINVFQVEPFKRELFDNISKGRSLVILGYSGSDDFDIVPTLKELKNLRDVIWINYVWDDEGKEKIYRIDENITKDMDKVSQILSDIQKMNVADNVYRVDVNTPRMLMELFDIKQKISEDNFSLIPIDWLQGNVKSPDKFEKYFMPFVIYYEFDDFEPAMRCLKEVLSMAEEEKDQYWKFMALNKMGFITFTLGDYTEALRLFEESLKCTKQLQDLDLKNNIINNIGEIYRMQGNYTKALENYESALKISEKLGNVVQKSSITNNIGLIYAAQGNYSKALKYYKIALKIDGEIGDLGGKTIDLNNIAEIFKAQGKYQEALKRYEEALDIAEELKNLMHKATLLNNIGMIYAKLDNPSKAINIMEQALSIFVEIGNDHYAQEVQKSIDILKNKNPN